jgi:hypothetical protein
MNGVSGSPFESARVLSRPLPGADAELRHGYTVAEISRLSVWAVRRERWHQVADFHDRLEVAWHAIIEHIYTAAEPPTERDVMYAGWRGIGEHVSSDYQFRGHDRQDRYAGTVAGFERYWWTTARATPGPEERVTDRVALAQIWPLLRPVLAAVAVHEDYGVAAAALGKARNTRPARCPQRRSAPRPPGVLDPRGPIWGSAARNWSAGTKLARASASLPYPSARPTARFSAACTLRAPSSAPRAVPGDQAVPIRGRNVTFGAHRART